MCNTKDNPAVEAAVGRRLYMLIQQLSDVVCHHDYPIVIGRWLVKDHTGMHMANGILQRRSSDMLYSR
jgi:hypothetical protein